jgi:hypothetical protein
MPKGDKKMPYLITSFLYPPDKVPEVVAKYQETMAKYPPNEKLFTTLIPVATKATHEGMQAFSIVEVKKGKLDEAYLYLAKSMNMFQSVQDVVFRLDIYATLEDAISMAPAK